MYRYLRSNRSYLQDQIDNSKVIWDEHEVDECKEILDCHGFEEIVENTFESKLFDDSHLNDDGGKYVCMISFRIPEQMILCRVEDRFETSSRIASEVTIRNKGGVFTTFRAAIQWLNANGLPSRLASQMLYDLPVD